MNIMLVIIHTVMNPSSQPPHTVCRLQFVLSLVPSVIFFKNSSHVSAPVLSLVCTPVLYFILNQLVSLYSAISYWECLQSISKPRFSLQPGSIDWYWFLLFKLWLLWLVLINMTKKLRLCPAHHFIMYIHTTVTKCAP